MKFLIKSALNNCCQSQLYEKFIELGFTDIVVLRNRLKENKDILDELGVADKMEHEKIINALNQEINTKILPVICLAVILIFTIPILWAKYF